MQQNGSFWTPYHWPDLLLPLISYILKLFTRQKHSPVNHNVDGWPFLTGNLIPKYKPIRYI